MPEDRALIHFRCVAEMHQEAKAGNSDTLTVHDGKWAYCPYDVRAKGHVWEDTGGLTVNDMRMLVDRSRTARGRATSD